jgi:hypothetical protein
MDQQPADSARGAICPHPAAWCDGPDAENIMRKIARGPALATAAAALIGAVPLAEAGSLGRPCTSAPESQWLSMPALQSKLEAQGYKVQKAKLKKACGEFYTLDKTGAPVELFVDPTNGTIVGRL